MRIPTVQLLSEWLKAHVQNLPRWTEPATGRIRDPFESHQHDVRILAESYSPATALVITAAAARAADADAAALLQGYCRRIGELLADEATPAFTALFLQYFGLLAIADLKFVADRENPPIDHPTVDAFAGMLCTWQDKLEVPVNTNCAAMQAGVEFLRHLNGGAADWTRCRERLEIVAAQQSASGFINDDLAGPSMPVAYHMFCMYLLAAAVARIGPAAPPVAQELAGRSDEIVRKGYGWLGRLLANDGMIAQFGRSRYHAFSQAAAAALLAAAGIEPEDSSIRRFLTWMDHRRLPGDATTGLAAPIFAVTPNHCPPALRVGYESYAMVTVYNNLAIAILLDAMGWWTGALPTLPSAGEARKAFFNAARTRGCHADAEVGLVCLRSRCGYALVNLQTDYRGTTPAGSLVHLRLGDDLHERAVAPPFWADPRVSMDMPEGSVWEGPLLCPAARDGCAPTRPPAFLMQGRTLQCQTTQSSISLRGSGPDAEWTRTVLLEPNRLTITWQVQADAPDQALLAVVPCLLWDGLWQTELRFDGPQIQATRDGRTWTMTITDPEGTPLEGSWFLTPYRSTLSTSGVTGRLQFPLASSPSADAPVSWKLRIELLPPQPT